MEEAFDLAREGRLAVTPDLIDCGLKACDVIRLILDEKAEGEAVQGEVEVTGAFARLLPVPEKAHADQSAESKPKGEVRGAFEIIFKPKREMFYSGSDPVTLLDDLRALGQAHITVHVDQVPLLPSLEAEHCYLWWEILLVTEQDQAAIKDVFVFVEDECDVSIRLLEDQAESVALLGSIPPEMLELFVVESEENLDRIELDALALEKDPASRDALDSLFRGVHSMKGNSGLLLDYVKDTPLKAAHPLQVMLRMAHALESLLDSFRGATVKLVTEEAIHIALDTCDAFRALLGNLTLNGAGGVVSPQLLEQLRIKTTSAPIGPSVDVREAAFLNTASQCVEMIANSLKRMENDSGPASPVLATYLRGLKTLAAAAQYRNCPELEEPLAQQIKILDAAAITGKALGSEDCSALGDAFLRVRAVLDHVSPGGVDKHLSEPAGGAPASAKTPAGRPSASAAWSISAFWFLLARKLMVSPLPFTDSARPPAIDVLLLHIQYHEPQCAYIVITRRLPRPPRSLPARSTSRPIVRRPSPRETAPARASTRAAQRVAVSSHPPSNEIRAPADRPTSPARSTRSSPSASSCARAWAP